MEDIRVSKDELMQRLDVNRACHRAAFEEAISGFREEVIRVLDITIDDAKAGRDVKANFSFVKPEDHSADYDRALEMLRMSLDDEIVLAEDDFQCFVMDDWGWKGKFVADYANYTKKSCL